MATLFLRNIEQVALFKFELCGQLSDGHWENSIPHDHWQVWCRCKVAVAPPGTAPGRNFWAKRDRYNLVSKDLLSVVGGRMLMQVRLTQGMGIDVAEQLEGRLGCPDDFGVEPIEVPRPELTDSYWAEQRAKLRKFDLGVVNTHLLHGNYQKKDLIKDLKEIAEAMRTWSDTKDLPEGPPKPTEPVHFYGHDTLARAIATLTGLKAVVCDPPPSDRNAWYDLVTSTGMVVTNFQTQPREDGTWVVMGKSLPFPDTAVWEKVQRLGT